MMSPQLFSDYVRACHGVHVDEELARRASEGVMAALAPLQGPAPVARPAGEGDGLD